MNESIFELFQIGIGPSSSHTMGPMRAACSFARRLHADCIVDDVDTVSVQLFGSLALTGKGHGTDRAVILGLAGLTPEGVDPERIEPILSTIRRNGILNLDALHPVRFDETEHIEYRRSECLPGHPNGMLISAIDRFGVPLRTWEYYSVGGGHVTSPHDGYVSRRVKVDATREPVYVFGSATDLLEGAARNSLSIAELVLANELTWRSVKEIRRGVLELWRAMERCVQRGLMIDGVLPGGLNVRRRAARFHASLTSATLPSHLNWMDWVNACAMAVSEENAAGSRVVTAPTNGAAGVIPATLSYYTRYEETASDEGILRFFLTAGAIGLLYRRNASISGADVGCQGEVGVACSMAAAGLAAALGGNNDQIEQAAEIGMEHHLGLTCDPVAGLVQVPCIERNAMGALKAINAARMALHGDGTHRVSLDEVIKTMKETGRDMQAKYKETSLGGLALHVVEC